MLVTEESFVRVFNERSPSDAIVAAAGTLLARQQIDYLSDLVNYEIRFAKKELTSEDRDALLAFLNPLHKILSRALEGIINRKYLVVVRGEFVRDTQVQFEAGQSEGWHDTTGEHVLGVFEAECAGEAINQASVVCRVSEDNLAAYELSGFSNRSER
ncbi:hypothetical protein ACFPOG_12880 [Paenibacillus aestuarii]|uniref:DUF2507 domain-containing protein n=2 Tax=Paenibacillus aestuarii TaxID=516965 RepID=A0ABW0K757_9BACL